MGSPLIQPRVVKTQALFCPNCGGPVELKGFAHTLTVVCVQCLSVLDASTPALNVLQQIQESQRRTPKIPLGSRGKFYNALYEVIGFQTRSILVDGYTYEWSEYVLFNPYRGFLYLTEYDGHWNLVRPVRALPVKDASGRKPTVTWDRKVYRHFQHADAETIFVMGEFPWRVQVGEKVAVDDYIAPPYSLASEFTGNETTWSLAEYITGKQLWETLQLKDSPPDAKGIYSNQPNPKADRPGTAWRLCGVFLLLLICLALYFSVAASRKVVLNERHHFIPGQAGEQSYVTPIFELTGHNSGVEVQTRTNLNNRWVYFNFALINNDTDQGWDFGREVSYYSGRDSDGNWSEGDPKDSIIIPNVPAGHYYLRVEPETEAGTPPVEYDIVVRRDVPVYTWFWVAAFLLLIPPIIVSWRTFKFEHARWQESDYASGSSSGGDDDD